MFPAIGERSEYTPGTFSWAELTTTDQDDAKSFYGDLFGWDADDIPMGEGAYYSMEKIDDKNVAAISPQRQAGVPPAWNSYLTIESADEAADRASELGGTVRTPAFDVFDAGRMAVIQDPEGAFFQVWEPKQDIGAGLVNAPGALCWNELQTTDIDAAADFYRNLFGWSTQPFEQSPDPYLVIQNQGRGNGGIRPVTPPGTPPYWLVYFATADIEQGLATVEELGGAKLAGPIDIGIATIGVVRDPQGAVFALYAGQLED